MGPAVPLDFGAALPSADDYTAEMYPEAPPLDGDGADPAAAERDGEAADGEGTKKSVDPNVVAFLPASLRAKMLKAAQGSSAATSAAAAARQRAAIKPAPGPRRPTIVSHTAPLSEAGAMAGSNASYVVPAAEASKAVAPLSGAGGTGDGKTNQEFADFMKEMAELGAFE